MLTLHGVFVFVCMGIFVQIQGNGDVIIRVKDSDDNYINISFTWHSFEEYHDCLCEKRKTCNGVYGKNIIYEIERDGKTDNDERYYLCEKCRSNVRCLRKNKSPKGMVTQKINCQSPDIELTLVWSNINEGFVFTDQRQCLEYCSTGCCSSPPRPTNFNNKDSDDDSSLGLIIGVVIAVIIMATAIAGVGIFLWRRKRRHNTSVPQVTKDSTGTHVFDNDRSLPLDRPTGTHGSTPYSVASVQAGLEMSALPNEEYGYSTVQDQAIDTGGYQTVPVSPYKLASGLESQHKDPGYEYAGPESGYDLVTNNNAARLTQDETPTTVPGSSSTVASLDKARDIYNRLHEDNRKVQNPYNTLLQSMDDGQEPQTATRSPVDQSKGNYTRLHEEKRKFQNPYNTLLKPLEDAGSSQTANQSSRYSFAQPTFNEVSNEKTDDNAEVHKVETSQNHTYHILEAKRDHATDGREEGGATAEKKRNNYFELEKQEDVTDSDTEAVFFLQL